MKSRLTPEVLLGIFAVAIAGFYARGLIKPEFTVDFMFFCGFIVLLLWLLWPAKRDNPKD
jgi:membrane protein implicated in regulation of membrane protease activity